MNRVFFDVGISLDGFMAGDHRGPKNPLGDNGISIHEWMFHQKAFLSHIGREGGETDNTDNDIIESIFDRAGAYIMGMRMFEEGEVNWPENAPFHAPVFVLTHTPRDPWERKGGTTFYFTDDSIENVLEKAMSVANGKDVRISGGAQTIRQYFNAGLIDDFSLHVAPVFIYNGLRLFDDLSKGVNAPAIINTTHSPRVTHINYRLKNH